MGITENNREVDIHYDKSKNQIIIKKMFGRDERQETRW